jgi:RNA polymerase sigma factor (TIGR02999 family)
MSSAECVTALLTRWKGGDQEALQALVPLVYKELRQLAHHCLQGERPHHTLQSTDLVHEAYLRLTKQGPAHFADRAYFFAVSAHLMRQILVDHARGRRAAKRDGGCKLTLDEALGVPDRKVDLVALDDVLNDLARIDARQSRIVELRFFGGLSIEETSEVLRVSPATVKREWATARVWLHREMKRTARA